MSILKNAVCPQHIPTYDGSDQSTHPSVLRFDAPWHGYLYWMAMTPYPYNNDGLEDPSILVSNDAQTWIVPEGLTNPLTPAPKPGHNCDVELVYNKERDELWLYYVEADDIVQSWVKLMRSADGVHWTKPEIVLHDPVQKYSILSPCIQRMQDGSWDDFCLYRTAFLLDREADVLRVWYGGKKKSDASWGIGYTEGQYSQICAALER